MAFPMSAASTGPESAATVTVDMRRYTNAASVAESGREGSGGGAGSVFSAVGSEAYSALLDAPSRRLDLAAPDGNIPPRRSAIERSITMAERKLA